MSGIPTTVTTASFDKFTPLPMVILSADMTCWKARCTSSVPVCMTVCAHSTSLAL